MEGCFVVAAPPVHEDEDEDDDWLSVGGLVVGALDVGAAKGTLKLTPCSQGAWRPENARVSPLSSSARLTLTAPA